MISDTFTFWTYLILLIFSVPCSLFALYYLLFDRNLRHILHNHLIITLLIIGLLQQAIIIPWVLYFYNHNRTWARSAIFCQIWTYIDWSLYVTQTFLFAWGTVERHIFIFHHQWTDNATKRVFLHYIPLIFIVLYGLIFHLIIQFFLPCENEYDNSRMACTYPCSLNYYWLGVWQTMLHQLFPLFIIVLFSLGLPVRVLWQKYRRNQPIQWGRYRKMIIQMFAISLLYLAFSFPLALLYAFNYFGLSQYLNEEIVSYAEFFSFFTYFIFPLISLLSLPDIRAKIRDMLRLLRWRTAIQPMSLTVLSVFFN